MTTSTQTNNTADLCCAYTLAQFLKKVNLPHSTYYQLRKQKRTPREIRFGRKILISHESAIEWLRHMENREVVA
jgi:hypothetical protein